MSIERVFLDWARPALAQVADLLLNRYARDGEADLSALVVALSGGRAGRRLLEILVQQAAARRLRLVPPRIVTAGQLPELLYQAHKPFASHFVQQLAWIHALRQCDASICRRLLPTLPDSKDFPGWLALGDLLGRLHRELAADGLDFRKVADGGSAVDGFAEHARWQALAAVQQAYLRALDDQNLWDQQTARLYAIEHADCHIEQKIFLVGTVDLNRSQRAMLDLVAGQVTALVFAPPELADRFDSHGCLRPEAWVEAVLPVASEQVEIVENPADQAAAVVRAIAGLGGRYPAEDIVVGVPDDRLVPYVQQHLEQYAVHARYGAGTPVTRSGAYRLLQVLADYLQAPQFASFAALVRHPDVHAWLARQGIAGDWLTPLDTYYCDHLPHELKESSRHTPYAVRPFPEVNEPQHGSHGMPAGEENEGGESQRRADGTRSVPATLAAIERLLHALRGKPQALDSWAGPLLDFLVQMLGAAPLNPTMEPDRGVLAAAHSLRDALAQLVEIPAAWMPTVSCAEAIALVLREAQSQLLSPLPDPQAIELLGWLELPLDDAPVTIVTGMNEGVIPSSLNGDLFLPNQLRRALGLEDNDRRCARDAYALAVLAASRAVLRLVAGRRNADGDPLTPSRLLFACDDGALAARVKRFFQGAANDRPQVSLGLLQPGGARSQFAIPRPRPRGSVPTSMRVTEFRDYLACPYRYYLRHVLRLASMSDIAEELDAAAFGNLAHHVLDGFGRSKVATSTSADEIRQHLDQLLDLAVKDFYDAPLAAVLVQIEQLRTRLAAFAAWQAAWARQGWRIEHVELDFGEKQAAMIVEGQPMYLRGRIDRIDVHPSGRRTVFDYKCSDSGRTPEQVHRERGQWVDLQLPLYRHLLASKGIAGEVQLGYIVLPKDVTQVGDQPAGWTAADLAEADRVAQRVVDGVRHEEFWPPAKVPPAFSEEFAAICQDGQFGAVLAAEAVEDGA